MVASVLSVPPLNAQFHGLTDFPAEVQTHLLYFFVLEPKKIAYIASVCKTWNQISKDIHLITRARLFRLSSLALGFNSPSDQVYVLLSVAEGAIENKVFKEAAFYLDRAKKIAEQSELRDIIKELLKIYEMQVRLPEVDRKKIIQELKSTISQASQTLAANTPATLFLPLFPGNSVALLPPVRSTSSLAYHYSKEIIRAALICGINDELFTLLEQIQLSEIEILKAASDLGRKEIVNQTLQRMSKNGKATRPVSFKTPEEMQESFDDLLKRPLITSYLDSLVEARDHIRREGFLDLFKKCLLKIETEVKSDNIKIYQTLARQWIKIGELDKALELAQVLMRSVDEENPHTYHYNEIVDSESDVFDDGSVASSSSDSDLYDPEFYHDEAIDRLDLDEEIKRTSRNVYLKLMAALIASGEEARAVEISMKYDQYLQGVVYFMLAEHKARTGARDEALLSVSKGEAILQLDWDEKIKDDLREYNVKALEAIVFAYAKDACFQEAFDLISEIKAIKIAKSGVDLQRLTLSDRFLLGNIREEKQELIDRLIVEIASLGTESWEVNLKCVDDSGREVHFTLWNFLSQNGKILVAEKLIEQNEFVRAQLYLQSFLALHFGDSQRAPKDIAAYLKENLETPSKIEIRILVILATYTAKAQDQKMVELCLSFAEKILENKRNLRLSEMNWMLELVKIGFANFPSQEVERIVDQVFKHPNHEFIFWDLVKVSFENGYYRGAYLALKSISAINDREHYRKAILAFFKTTASKSLQHNS